MLKIALKDEVKNEDRSPSQFSDYKGTLPEASLKIGEDEVKIIKADADEQKNAEAIPANTVVFTKGYHEPCSEKDTISR
jgi:hypothetical protein